MGGGGAQRLIFFFFLFVVGDLTVPVLLPRKRTDIKTTRMLASAGTAHHKARDSLKGEHTGVYRILDLPTHPAVHLLA